MSTETKNFNNNVTEALSSFFSKINSPDIKKNTDLSLGDEKHQVAKPKYNINEQSYKDARDSFLQTTRNTIEHMVDIDKRREKRFYALLIISVIFLLVVVVITNLLINAGQDVEVALGTNTGVLGGYLLLLRGLLKHEEKWWKNQQVVKTTEPLLLILHELGNDMSPDHFIRITQVLRGVVSNDLDQ